MNWLNTFFSDGYFFAFLIALIVLGQIQAAQLRKRLTRDDSHSVVLAAFKGIPHHEIREKQAQLEMLGFRRLVDYTKDSFNTLAQRYVCSAFNAPDGVTLGSVEYYRSWRFGSFLASLMRWERLYLMFGIVFTTFCEDGTRILTSSIMREDIWQESTKTTKVPPGTPLAEMYRIHREKVESFTKPRDISAIKVSSADELFRLNQIHLQKTARHFK